MKQLDYLLFRQLLKAWGYEVVNRKGTFYLRRRPYTRDKPSPAMRRAREAMALASRSSEGSTGFSEDGLPIVAARNRTLIPEARLFLRVRRPERVRMASKVADEVGLDPEEKERLIALVS